MKRFAVPYTLLFVLFFLFFGSCGIFKPDPVTLPELEEHVRVLASDGMEGRLFGTEGIRLAEEYIAGRFREFGLSPLQFDSGEESYFLPFSLEAHSWDMEEPLVSISTGREGDGIKGDFYFDPENYPLPGTMTPEETSISGEIIFAGYGIDAPEHSWNDYRNIDAEGKIVLVFRHEPNEDDPSSVFDGRRHSEYATFWNKMGTAKRYGAAGLLLIDDPRHDSDSGPYAPPPGFAGPEDAAEVRQNGVPGIHISAGQLQSLYPSIDFRAVQEEIDRGGDLPVLPYAEGTIRLRKRADTEEAAGRNVAAYRPSRVNRRGGVENETDLIIIGAHHDHLGTLSEGAPGDRIFNGADDNASGVAALLELAEYFSNRRLSAGLLFVTFSAEELGLYGSGYLLEQIPDLQEKTAAMINFDMIGRNPEDEVTVQYSGPEEFVSLVREGLSSGYRLQRQTGRMQGYISDSYTFYTRDIPTLFFFTGLHSDYHRPSDEADRIEYDGMKKIAEDAAAVIENIADFFSDS